MRWLADRFGLDPLIQAEVLLPTADHFPDPYHGTERDARRFLDRLAGVMGLEPSNLILRVCDDHAMPGAAGLYDRSDPEHSVIAVAASQLADPQRLIATLAHELSHELLMGRGLIARDAADFEWLTDLTPVFFGVGIFAANATLTESYSWTGNVGWWSIGRQGYLSSRHFGYAFALFAFMRGETAPAWARFLRLDASSPLAAGLRYLRRGGESLFHPDTIHSARPPLTTSDAARRLRQGSAPSRLATLWAIAEQGLKDPALIPEISRLLGDRDQDLAAEAASHLAIYGVEAARAVPELVRALSSNNEVTQERAAQALGAIGAESELVVPALAGLLESHSSEVVSAAAVALGTYGRDAAVALDRLLAALRAMLVNGGGSEAEDVVTTLCAASPDPARLVRDFFTDEDRDFRQLALAMIAARAEHDELETLVESLSERRTLGRAGL
jgi:hypothetical protein